MAKFLKIPGEEVYHNIDHIVSFSVSVDFMEETNKPSNCIRLALVNGTSWKLHEEEIGTVKFKNILAYLTSGGSDIGEALFKD